MDLDLGVSISILLVFGMMIGGIFSFVNHNFVKKMTQKLMKNLCSNLCGKILLHLFLDYQLVDDLLISGK